MRRVAPSVTQVTLWRFLSVAKTLIESVFSGRPRGLRLMRVLAQPLGRGNVPMNRRAAVLLAASLIPAITPMTNPLAQSGIIRIIVGTAPGGAIDPYARIIAEHMSRTLGQPIIIENKPGASGTSPTRPPTERSCGLAPRHSRRSIPMHSPTRVGRSISSGRSSAASKRRSCSSLIRACPPIASINSSHGPRRTRAS